MSKLASKKPKGLGLGLGYQFFWNFGFGLGYFANLLQISNKIIKKKKFIVFGYGFEYRF